MSTVFLYVYITDKCRTFFIIVHCSLIFIDELSYCTMPIPVISTVLIHNGRFENHILDGMQTKKLCIFF